MAASARSLSRMALALWNSTTPEMPIVQSAEWMARDSWATGKRFSVFVFRESMFLFLGWRCFYVHLCCASTRYANLTFLLGQPILDFLSKSLAVNEDETKTGTSKHSFLQATSSQLYEAYGNRVLSVHFLRQDRQGQTMPRKETKPNLFDSAHTD